MKKTRFHQLCLFLTFPQACVILALWLVALSCNATTAQNTAIQTKDFYAFATIDKSKISAVFGTLSNTSDKPIALQQVVIKGDLGGTAELHRTLEEQGVMKMLPVDSLEIPAHSDTKLAPMGLHIMLIDLTKPLEEGRMIDLELIFDNGTTLDLQVPIRARQKDHRH